MCTCVRVRVNVCTMAARGMCLVARLVPGLWLYTRDAGYVDPGGLWVRAGVWVYGLGAEHPTRPSRECMIAAQPAWFPGKMNRPSNITVHKVLGAACLVLDA